MYGIIVGVATQSRGRAASATNKLYVCVFLSPIRCEIRNILQGALATLWRVREQILHIAGPHFGAATGKAGRRAQKMFFLQL